MASRRGTCTAAPQTLHCLYTDTSTGSWAIHSSPQHVDDPTEGAAFTVRPMSQTPIYDQLRGERIGADVPASAAGGTDPQRSARLGKHHLPAEAPAAGSGFSVLVNPGAQPQVNQHPAGGIPSVTQRATGSGEAVRTRRRQSGPAHNPASPAAAGAGGAVGGPRPVAPPPGAPAHRSLMEESTVRLRIPTASPRDNPQLPPVSTTVHTLLMPPAQIPSCGVSHEPDTNF
jgi:hypothetical protein